jgi:hypothetical protein
MMMLRRIALALIALAFALPASAQKVILPVTRFGTADVAHLKWLEGSWQGDAPGAPTIYERYHFVNDSTIEITYFGDSAFGRETGSGRVYVSVGRVFQTSGPARWGATHVGADGAAWLPQQNAPYAVTWTYQSPNAWTATQRASGTGVERTTVYQMRRVR